MVNFLLYISSFLIIFSFICYFIMILIGRIKVISKSDGFDVTKDIISEYNSINVIESKNYFSFYNIKRKVIKLDTKCYYGKDLSSISLSLMEAGISIVDNKKNIYIDIIRTLFSNLKLLYIFPVLAIFINNSSFNISDAKVSIFIIFVFSVIQYILIDIKSNACNWVSTNINKIKDINKDNGFRVNNFLNKMILFDKVIFFGELIMIARFVCILLEIK